MAYHRGYGVNPSDVEEDNNVKYYSYGNISPFMDSDDVVWTVWLDGGIYGNRPMVDNGSYGYFLPYTIIFSGVYIVRLDGDMYGYDNDNSYGI